MTERSAYTYTILRYCHDTTTGEFVNVGVAMHCRDQAYVSGLFGVSVDRLSAMFPRMGAWPAASQVKAIEDWFATSAATLNHDSIVTVMDVARQALPLDDGSLQWSSMGSGITLAPEDTLHDLYARFVGHAGAEANQTRSDAQVWNAFRDEFQHVKILPHLKEHVVTADGRELKFDHAWKNGLWHCFVPVSFHLASPSEIKDKAFKLLGRVTSVRTTCDPLKLYFLVSVPQQATLAEAARAGLGILAQSTFDVEVIEESDAPSFAHRMAADMNIGLRKRTAWRT